MSNKFNLGDYCVVATDDLPAAWPKGYSFKAQHIDGLMVFGYNALGGMQSINMRDISLAYSKPIDEPIKSEKNMNVNYHILKESVVVSYDGKSVVVAKSDKRYEKVIACIKEERLEDIPMAVDLTKQFEGTGFTLKDGTVLDEQENPLPQELNERIIQFKDEGLPYKPLMAFWENLKKNPSFNSRKALYKFLEHNGHPLTQDGCFIAYRGVTEDFKDKHTKKFDNSPGQVVEMPRDEVDDNPNNTCSSGLHVACFEYAKDFGKGGKLVEVKVNPADVVTVPVDYNGTKMRVCKFEVVQVCAEMRTELLDGHKNEPESPGELVKVNPADNNEDEEYENDEDVCRGCGDERMDPWANYCGSCGEEF